MDYSKELTSKKDYLHLLKSKFQCHNVIDVAKVTTLSSMCSYGQWLKILGTHPCICIPSFFWHGLPRFGRIIHAAWQQELMEVHELCSLFDQFEDWTEYGVAILWRGL
jgi:hypothetical protein